MSQRKGSAWKPYSNSGKQLSSPTLPRLSALAYIYLTICCLCLLATYFALNRLEAQQLQSLKHSVYFYSHEGIKSTETAEWLHAHVGIHTLDLLSSGAGAEVHRLTGANSAASPSLVVPVRGGIQIFSTPLAVQQELQPVLDGTSPMRLGKQALNELLYHSRHILSNPCLSNLNNTARISVIINTGVHTVKIISMSASKTDML